MLWSQDTKQHIGFVCLLFFFFHWMLSHNSIRTVSVKQICYGELWSASIIVSFVLQISFQCLLSPSVLDFSSVISESSFDFVLKNLYPSYIIVSLPTAASWVAWWQFQVLAGIWHLLNERMKTYTSSSTVESTNKVLSRSCTDPKGRSPSFRVFLPSEPYVICYRPMSSVPHNRYLHQVFRSEWFWSENCLRKRSGRFHCSS